MDSTQAANEYNKERESTEWHRPANMPDIQTGLPSTLAERLSQASPTDTELNSAQGANTGYAKPANNTEIAALAQQLSAIPDQQTQQQGQQKQPETPQLSPEEKIRMDFEDTRNKFEQVKQIALGTLKEAKGLRNWGNRRAITRATIQADKQISTILKRLKGKEPDEKALKEMYAIVENYLDQVSDSPPIAKAA